MEGRVFILLLIHRDYIYVPVGGLLLEDVDLLRHGLYDLIFILILTRLIKDLRFHFFNLAFSSAHAPLQMLDRLILSGYLALLLAQVVLQMEYLLLQTFLLLLEL
jgi:hypothetical protein